MRREVIVDLDPDDLMQMVGAAAYAKALQLVRQDAVVDFGWDLSRPGIVGKVRGSLGAFYTTTAMFSEDEPEVPGHPPTYRFEWGECTCPVGFSCKHVAALVLTAIDGAPRSEPGAPKRADPVNSWEQSLQALLAADTEQDQPGDTPLAIELTTSLPKPSQYTRDLPMSPRLIARIVQPGKTGWVARGLTWSQVSMLQHRMYRRSHVRLLQQLYGAYRAQRLATSSYYSSSYGDDKTIDLAGFESRQLWEFLTEARTIGLQLVHSRKHLGPIDPFLTGELCLDVTYAGDDSLQVRPMLMVDDEPTDVVPVAFIGSSGHGVVGIHPADAGADPATWRLRLIRLTKPAPSALRQLAMQRQRLELPVAEVARFNQHYYPRLRGIARVISSDGCFTPPAISEPSLVLRAAYGDDHELDLAWEWRYDVDGSPLRVPFDAAGGEDDYRDLEAERRLLGELHGDLGSLQLLPSIAPDQTGHPVGAAHLPATPQPGPGEANGPGRRLTSADTMRFSTELLPALKDEPRIVVEISGDPADYREVGDSVRIDVSTSEVAGETDWFDLGITLTVAGRDIPFLALFTALARGETYMILPDGAYFSLDKPELRSLTELIAEARALQDKPGGPLRISRYQAGFWDELAEIGVVANQATTWRQQVEGLLSIDALIDRPQPAALSAKLRAYQLDGFKWLTFLSEARLGGILADDMGLGKTLQTLALICHTRATAQQSPAQDSLPFLVVAPASVVSNWASEAARFADGLSVVPITDTLKRRKQDLAEAIDGADVVVTSYTLLRLDADAYCSTTWAGLILDEAQFVKNHQSKTYQCARRVQARFKLAVTGTPLENNVMELWSLLSITAPGLFPNPTRFRDYYAKPIENGDSELLAQLRRRIKPLVKRRTKEQVAKDLPAKQEQVLEVELHPKHRKVYDTHLQRERQKVLHLVDDMNANRFTIFGSLTLLRQLSLHAGLVGDEHADLPSSKIDALLEHLEDVVQGGHRALVFSQFTGFLDKVRRRLDATGVRYCYLDGSTRNRAAVIKRFKDGEAPVFLISLKAGGFGLNLTEADYCFLLDPWWNPATEAQAVDRTHRIGQTRNVMVYRLIAKDTIEEKVMALKAKKAELFASVMDDGNAFGANLDADDIRGLFA
jgi:superfamily II DNA or RNA helicase